MCGVHAPVRAQDMRQLYAALQQAEDAEDQAYAAACAQAQAQGKPPGDILHPWVALMSAVSGDLQPTAHLVGVHLASKPLKFATVVPPW